MEEKIEYVSKGHWRGVLYDWHDDPFSGEHYQMSVYNADGAEVLHAYNATPQNIGQLKAVVDAEQMMARVRGNKEE